VRADDHQAANALTPQHRRVSLIDARACDQSAIVDEPSPPHTRAHDPVQPREYP
jgi:hypothetical protein